MPSDAGNGSLSKSGQPVNRLHVEEEGSDKAKLEEFCFIVTGLDSIS